MKNILFLCVANSARSQMAEGLAREILKGKAEVQSAGSVPTKLNPLAQEVMSEIGINISNQYSKSADSINPETIDTVITLCQEEVCPTFLGRALKLHWPFADPAAAVGSQADRLESFRQVRDQIKQQLESYASQI